MLIVNHETHTYLMKQIRIFVITCFMLFITRKCCLCAGSVFILCNKNNFATFLREKVAHPRTRMDIFVTLRNPQLLKKKPV